MYSLVIQMGDQLLAELWEHRSRNTAFLITSSCCLGLRALAIVDSTHE
jgi:hypothetical protein